MAGKKFKQRSIMPFSVTDLSVSPELKKHQHMMTISTDDRDNLKNDIKTWGDVRDPIKIYFAKNGDGLILAGFNRWEIAKELKFDTVPVEVYSDLTPKEREELVINDNLNRRHFTEEQKRELIKYFLKKETTSSNRAIGKKVGSDPKSVAKQRKELEEKGEISKPDVVKGKDGRVYNTKKIEEANKSRTENNKKRPKKTTGEVPLSQIGVLSHKISSWSKRVACDIYGKVVELNNTDKQKAKILSVIIKELKKSQKKFGA